MARGLINLRGTTIGAVEPVADLLEGQFFLVSQAEHQRLAAGPECFGLAHGSGVKASPLIRE
jgi:hypothetical protein